MVVFCQVMIFLLDSDSHKEDKNWAPPQLLTKVTIQTITPPMIIIPLDTTDICNQARNLREAIENTTGTMILSQ